MLSMGLTVGHSRPFPRFPLREEFADSLEHPDPVPPPPALLPESESNRAILAEPNAESGCGQQVGSGVPDKAQGGMHKRPQGSPNKVGAVN